MATVALCESVCSFKLNLFHDIVELTGPQYRGGVTDAGVGGTATRPRNRGQVVFQLWVVECNIASVTAAMMSEYGRRFTTKFAVVRLSSTFYWCHTLASPKPYDSPLEARLRMLLGTACAEQWELLTDEVVKLLVPGGWLLLDPYAIGDFRVCGLTLNSLWALIKARHPRLNLRFDYKPWHPSEAASLAHAITEPDKAKMRRLFEDATMRRLRVLAAKLIQRAWRAACCDPHRALGARLLRESFLLEAQSPKRRKLE